MPSWRLTKPQFKSFFYRNPGNLSAGEAFHAVDGPRMEHSTARILLVEDDEQGATLMTLILRRAGYEVVTASGATSAIRNLSTVPFDVVLTDMLMPDGDGIELMMFIREMSARPAVIPMSGGGMFMDASDMLNFAVKMGSRPPLVKPFSPAKLLEAVVEALKERATS